MSPDSLKRYWHTIRHLKPIQYVGYASRLIQRALPPGPVKVGGVGLRTSSFSPLTAFLPASYALSGTATTFLHETVDHGNDIRWCPDGKSKLWRYRLQSMDFLRQPGLTRSATRSWMLSWVQGNPEPAEEGWEPYPTSLRIVNWLKVWWEQGVVEEDQALRESLYAQARHLRRFIEWHLQANHLFENIKAVFLAGCAFTSAESDGWKRWAAPLLCREIREQVLGDGGHCERSPMYHALVLEGCLDLLNVEVLWKNDHPELFQLLRSRTPSMLAWLEAMVHPDGEIALFNDAVLRVPASAGLLMDYGRKLGLTWLSDKASLFLKDSGYALIRDDPHYIVVDVGPIGPEYQPAHGHCDLLSFEWSVGPRRFICDTGVFAYQDEVMRPYVRSTRAHNTICVDRQDQSEVWKEFRVARRARPLGVQMERARDGAWVIIGGHDGYRRLPGRPIHRRRFRYLNGALAIEDAIEGRGTHDIEAYLHFHPRVNLDCKSGQHVDIFEPDRRIGSVLQTGWEDVAIVSGWYCEEFGKREPRTVLKLKAKATLPFEAKVEITVDDNNQAVSHEHSFRDRELSS